jgi:DNA-binding transcriptional regulator YdaS (Cro superfamily)
MSAIEDAIERAKGMRPLAKRLGVTHQTVLKWRDGRLRITAERAIDVERETGVPRHRLRPDLWSNPDAGAPTEEAA